MPLLCSLLGLFVLVIFLRIILSWFPLDPDGPMATVTGFLYMITEPVLGPVRRALPPVRLGGMGLDLSPIVVLIGVQIVRGYLC